MGKYGAAALSLTCVMGLAAAVIGWATAGQARAHCQVPCGIYDDAARISGLREDAKTISKATQAISELAGTHDAPALNQATRWIITKEEHASHIIEVVAQYFLTQKVAPVAKGAEGYDKYLGKLADHHAVMVAAMKAKQTVDKSAVEALEKAIEQLATYY